MDHQPSTDNDDDDDGENNVGDKSDGVNKQLREPPGDFDMSDSATAEITGVGPLIYVYWHFQNQFFDGTVNAINNHVKYVVLYNKTRVKLCFSVQFIIRFSFEF